MTVREYTDLIIARARELDGRDPLRRVVQRVAKRYQGILEFEQLVAARGETVSEPTTIEMVAAACHDECEGAATWLLEEAGRAQLVGILAL
jgi:hypothetical protein